MDLLKADPIIAVKMYRKVQNGINNYFNVIVVMG